MPTVITMGEAMVRFSTPPGVSLEDAPLLEVRVAGAESNVAIGVSRLGVDSGWISFLVDQPLGRRVLNSIRLHGVDTRAVRWHESGRIPIYFIELGGKPRGPRVIYDRDHSPFRVASPEEVDWSYLAGATFFHTSGISSALNRALVERAVREAKARGIRVSFDVNYRAKLAPLEVYRSDVSAVLADVEVLFCTADDARLVFGIDAAPAAQAQRLAETSGASIVVVTDGSRGACLWHAGHSSTVGSFSLDEVDRVGAGDAFVAGFLAGLYEDGPELALRYASAYAALKHTYYGDIAWINRTELRRIALAGEAEEWR